MTGHRNEHFTVRYFDPIHDRSNAPITDKSFNVVKIEAYTTPLTLVSEGVVSKKLNV